MNKKIYVVIVRSEDPYWPISISQEAYDTFEKAKEFCENRENGNIKKESNFMYKGELDTYIIKELDLI